MGVKVEERFKPFVRDDVAVLSSPYELLKTVVMAVLLPARVLATLLCLAMYSGVCRVASWGLREQDMAQVYKAKGLFSLVPGSSHVAAGGLAQLAAARGWPAAVPPVVAAVARLLGARARRHVHVQ